MSLNHLELKTKSEKKKVKALQKRSSQITKCVNEHGVLEEKRHINIYFPRQNIPNANTDKIK